MYRQAGGVNVMVDGAHALGHIPVNLTELQVCSLLSLRCHKNVS